MRERSIIGGYEIVKRIGSGGMSTVYKAVDGQGREVALKLLHPEVAADPVSRDRLRREVRMLQRVRGEYVAQILDAETEEDEVFIVTQLIDGPTLDADVRDSGRYEGSDLVDLGEELAAALRSIHAVGVLHRDLKPSNVMMGAEGPVLIDFGIAQLGHDTRITRTGSLSHTPGWADPRVIRGGAPDEMADWWSLAAVLAFAATGVVPFAAETTPAVMHRVLHGEAHVPGLDPRAENAFWRALEPDGSRRITFDALVEELRSTTAAGAVASGGTADGAGHDESLQGQHVEEWGGDEQHGEVESVSTGETVVAAEGGNPPTLQLPVVVPQRRSMFDRPLEQTVDAPGMDESGVLGVDEPAFDPARHDRLPVGDWFLPARKARLHVLLIGAIVAIFGLAWPGPAALTVAALVVAVSIVGGADRGLKDRRVARGGPYEGDVGRMVLRLPFTVVGALLHSAVSLAVGGGLGWLVVVALEALDVTDPELNEPIGLVSAMVVAWLMVTNRDGREGARILLEAIAPTPGYRLFWLMILLVVAMSAVMVVGQSGLSII